MVERLYFRIKSIVQYAHERNTKTREARAREGLVNRQLLLLLLLFLTFSALVANPKKLLYTVANPARGLLNREKKKKKKSGSAPPPRAARSEKK